jgi:FkbM family methyltransferase
MYSQNDEESHILAALPSTGVFLDIGAFDGKTFSNTLALAEKGWHGCCVEPSPPVFKSLFELHKNNNNIRCVLAAITPERDSKIATFYDSNGDALGTLSTNHVDKWSGYAKFNPFILWTTPLATLLNGLNSIGCSDFDFVNIDVEGSSVDLFKEFVSLYKGTRLKCLCVEHDGRIQECHNLAASLGMHQILMNGENLIYVK